MSIIPTTKRRRAMEIVSLRDQLAHAALTAGQLGDSIAYQRRRLDRQSTLLQWWPVRVALSFCAVVRVCSRDRFFADAQE